MCEYVVELCVTAGNTVARLKKKGTGGVEAIHVLPDRYRRRTRPRPLDR